MKKLFLIAALAVASSAAFAQRSVDLAIDSIWAPATITHQQQIAVDFSIRNDGPDDMKVGDTILYQCTIVLGSSSLPTQLLGVLVDKTYSVGDTMHIRLNINPINVTGSGNGSFCATAVVLNKGTADPIADETAGTAPNNTHCRTTYFAGTTGIGSFGVSEYKMSTNIYPNPVANEGVISFELSSSAQVTVRVMDISGKVLMTVADEKMSAGKQEVRLNTSGLSNGVYFYEVNYDGNVSRNKFVIAQ